MDYDVLTTHRSSASSLQSEKSVKFANIDLNNIKIDKRIS